MDAYVSSAYRAIPKMIKDVYFDASRPDNQTVRYPNVRAPHMQVATRGGGWEYRDKAEVMREIVECNLEHLGEHAESSECRVNPFALKKFRECQELLDGFLQETNGNTRAAGVWRRVQRDVEMVILSNRKALAP
nr:hypothetical protein TetV2_00212 [Oceanusvirus sp.]